MSDDRLMSLRTYIKCVGRIPRHLIGAVHACFRRHAYRRILDDSRLARNERASRRFRRGSDETSIGATLVAVYRYRNGETLRALINQDDPSSYDIQLWALDDVHEDLEAWTVGSGPGSKFELINRLVREINVSHYLIVADDDIVIKHGSIRKLLSLGKRSGFGLFQAAHARSSLNTYPITTRRLLAKARHTTFVEIGPLFVVAPQWRQRFLPFPDDIGMGWGLEIEWHRVQREGCRFGIVDAVRLIHLVAPGASYVHEGTEQLRLDRVIEANEITLEEIQQELEVWWRWSDHPPWNADRES